MLSAVLTVAMLVMLSGTTVSAQGTYTAKPGDNLSKIAQEMYGDSLKWRLIYETNKSQIKDPNIIFSNQILTIPNLEGEVPVPALEVSAMPVAEEIPAAPVTDEISEIVEEETVVPATEDTAVSGQGYTLVLYVYNDSGKDYKQIYIKTEKSANWHLWFDGILGSGEIAEGNNLTIPNEYIALRVLRDDGTEFTWECDTLRVGWNYQENGDSVTGQTWTFAEEACAEVGVAICPSIDGTSSITWM